MTSQKLFLHVMCSTSNREGGPSARRPWWDNGSVKTSIISFIILFFGIPNLTNLDHVI